MHSLTLAGNKKFSLFEQLITGVVMKKMFTFIIFCTLLLVSLQSIAMLQVITEGVTESVRYMYKVMDPVGYVTKPESAQLAEEIRVYNPTNIKNSQPFKEFVLDEATKLTVKKAFERSSRFHSSLKAAIESGDSQTIQKLLKDTAPEFRSPMADILGSAAIYKAEKNDVETLSKQRDTNADIINNNTNLNRSTSNSNNNLTPNNSNNVNEKTQNNSPENKPKNQQDQPKNSDEPNNTEG